MARRKAKKPRPEQPKPDINVTPLVDIVLVLLIIFMVVTPALAQGEATDVPLVNKISQKKEMNQLKLIMTAQGRILMDKRPVRPEQLEDLLKAAYAKDPNRGVLLNTDVKVPYGKVRDVLAMLYNVGFKGVSLKVQPRKQDGQES
jgi:biopolymer transport protein ExbD